MLFRSDSPRNGFTLKLDECLCAEWLLACITMVTKAMHDSAAGKQHYKNEGSHC